MTITEFGRAEARRSRRRASANTAVPPDRSGQCSPINAVSADVDPESAARTICLSLLDRRARSRTELAEALAARQVPEDAANAVLDRFTEVGLIDDAALAGGLAQAQHRERGLSARAIERKLRERGIDDEQIRLAVSGIDSGSERATAEQLVTRKLRSLSGLDLQVQTRRLVSLLARKGYAPGLAYEVVRSVLGNQDLADLPDAGD